MAREIELKAWVEDRDAIEHLLTRLCTFRREFRKEDVYYEASQAQENGGKQKQQLRLRLDEETAVCTFKEKEIRNGVERSIEREFGVGDAAVFEELLLRIGCRVYLRKTKLGSLYTCDGLSVELAEVTGLGTFLEIEYVSEESDEESATGAESRIRALLTRLGVSEERIEPRPYAQLLLEHV